MLLTFTQSFLSFLALTFFLFQFHKIDMLYYAWCGTWKWYIILTMWKLNILLLQIKYVQRLAHTFVQYDLLLPFFCYHFGIFGLQNWYWCILLKILQYKYIVEMQCFFKICLLSYEFYHTCIQRKQKHIQSSLHPGGHLFQISIFF